MAPFLLQLLPYHYPSFTAKYLKFPFAHRSVASHRIAFGLSLLLLNLRDSVILTHLAASAAFTLWRLLLPGNFLSSPDLPEFTWLYCSGLLSCCSSSSVCWFLFLYILNFGFPLIPKLLLWFYILSLGDFIHFHIFTIVQVVFLPVSSSLTKILLLS